MKDGRGWMIWVVYVEWVSDSECWWMMMSRVTGRVECLVEWMQIEHVNQKRDDIWTMTSIALTPGAICTPLESSWRCMFCLCPPCLSTIVAFCEVRGGWVGLWPGSHASLCFADVETEELCREVRLIPSELWSMEPQKAPLPFTCWSFPLLNLEKHL